jgi:septum site-determining protein MinC
LKKNKSSKVKKFLESKKARVQAETQETPAPPEPETSIAEHKIMPRAAAEHGTTSRPAAGEERTAYGVEDNTILIKRTVRSGQCIQYDGNIVVLGDVNPGSELIASGNIVVMGSLRGVVHAGATGNEEATVAAFRLLPTQLRIANHITRAPDGDYLLPEQPEIARIKDGVVVIEAYQINQDKQMRIC